MGVPFTPARFGDSFTTHSGLHCVAVELQPWCRVGVKNSWIWKQIWWRRDPIPHVAHILTPALPTSPPFIFEAYLRSESSKNVVAIHPISFTVEIIELRIFDERVSHLSVIFDVLLVLLMWRRSHCPHADIADHRTTITPSLPPPFKPISSTRPYESRVSRKSTGSVENVRGLG